jgi:hypothetical protein
MGKAPERAGDAFFAAPNLGSAEDLVVAILAVLAVVVLVLVVIPLLLFGLELILLRMVIAAGIFTRTLLGRPWIVEAMPLDGDAKRLGWRVGGRVEYSLGHVLWTEDAIAACRVVRFDDALKSAYPDSAYATVSVPCVPLCHSLFVSGLLVSLLGGLGSSA